MATFPGDATRVFWAASSRDVSVATELSAVSTVFRLMFSELPDDVKECEVTIIAFFRASCVFNFVTGGAPKMTFSARAWHSRRTSRHILARLGWRFTVHIVNSACAALRGERDHCAVAWANYVQRLTRQAPTQSGQEPAMRLQVNNSSNQQNHAAC
ncbi:MAG: hypothetical protein AAF479_01645 [Pseudomonadota bacterium]